MPAERTLSIIKPDATKRNLTGAVNAVIEKSGLRIVGQKRVWLSEGQAEGFYAVHKERPFFRDLVTFMISGPVVVHRFDIRKRLIGPHWDMMEDENVQLFAPALRHSSRGTMLAASQLSRNGTTSFSTQACTFLRNSSCSSRNSVRSMRPSSVLPGPMPRSDE